MWRYGERRRADVRQKRGFVLVSLLGAEPQRTPSPPLGPEERGWLHAASLYLTVRPEHKHLSHVIIIPPLTDTRPDEAAAARCSTAACSPDVQVFPAEWFTTGRGWNVPLQHKPSIQLVISSQTNTGQQLPACHRSCNHSPQIK